ncbi:hypothetical protein ACF0H5_005644 [Mactra antiquata]
MAARAIRVFSYQSVDNIKRTLKTLFSRKYLLYTNTGISVFMSCAGDGLQQRYQISHKEITGWDRRRSRDVGVTGLVIGPFCHFWYIFLDWWLPGKTFRVVTKKLLVDQLLCSPITIFSFLSLTSYLEGKRGKELKNELVTKGKTLYAAEWIIWPPAQIVNFCLLPTKYRVLFDNSVSFGFDWYFSYVKYGKCLNLSEEVKCDKELLSDDSDVLNFGNYGQHVPFLHIQAAPMVESHIGQFHWDNWNEWFYHVRGKSKNPTEGEIDDVIDEDLHKKNLSNSDDRPLPDFDDEVEVSNDDTSETLTDINDFIDSISDGGGGGD